jgi:uncharacterized protein (TIGR03437 family)
MQRGLPVFALIFAMQMFGDVQTLTQLPNNAIANGVQLDAAGNIYLAGEFDSNPQNPNAPDHAFAAKLSPNGSQILWWTVFAGSMDDRAVALALGSDNSVYITGTTDSVNFPTTPGSMQPTGVGPGVYQPFAAKLNPSGAVVYSTYAGGSAGGFAKSITVDAAGHAFITGINQGSSFPVTPGTVSSNSNSGGFIIELDPTGSSAVLAIAGFGGYQIALDAQGNIYTAGAFVTAGQLGPGPPTTAGAFQSTTSALFCDLEGLFGDFPCYYQHIAKIDPTGTKLIYATYLAGKWGAIPSGIAVDADGNVILSGTTNSPDYPTTPSAYQPEYFANPQEVELVSDFDPPPSAGYITKLNANGTALLWSTFFAGSSALGDSIRGMAIDSSGNILIAGFTDSADLPGLWNTPVASRPAVMPDNESPLGFVARLTPDGTTLSPTQLVNGLLRDLADPAGGAIAVLADGTAIVDGNGIYTASLSSVGRVAAICDTADAAKIVRVAPGQLLTLYGTNLAPLSAAPPSTAFPTSLNGVTVTFNGIAAPILYTSGIQINLQVPYEISGQTQVTMQVSSQLVSPAESESFILAVADRQPSVFVSAGSFDQSIYDIASCAGQSIGGLQPLAVNADGSLNSCANPAPAGSTVTIFMNGLGASSPAQMTGAVSSSPVAISPTAALAGQYTSPSTPSTPTTTLPTETLPGSIASLAQVQIQVAADSPMLLLEVTDLSGVVYLVRGPGVVIWTSPPQ